MSTLTPWAIGERVSNAVRELDDGEYTYNSVKA